MPRWHHHLLQPSCIGTHTPDESSLLLLPPPSNHLCMAANAARQVIFLPTFKWTREREEFVVEMGESELKK
jgi:hypothetical protein